MAVLLAIVACGVVFLLEFLIAIIKDEPKMFVVWRFDPIWIQRTGATREGCTVESHRKAA